MNRINIKAGGFTYGQRIDLGRIFSTEGDEFEKFNAVFLCLHEKKRLPTPDSLEYFQEIMDGLAEWAQKESELLKYEPSPEELRAGIKQLSEKIGDLGTIKAMAKAYSIDPDEVLKWKYSKVFGILYTDLEEYKFQKKLNQVYEDKYKK